MVLSSVFIISFPAGLSGFKPLVSGRKALKSRRIVAGDLQLSVKSPRRAKAGPRALPREAALR
jgi:hypothetical protein